MQFFFQKLVVWWEKKLQHCPQVILVLCGSQSIWVEDNIINGTAFFGRLALMLELEDLSLKECATFVKTLGFRISDYDTYELLSVTGDVPCYLELLAPHEPVDNNIKKACFEKGETTQPFLIALACLRSILRKWRTKSEYGLKMVFAHELQHLPLSVLARNSCVSKSRVQTTFAKINSPPSANLSKT